MTGDLADRAREIVGAAHLITDQAQSEQVPEMRTVDVAERC